MTGDTNSPDGVPPLPDPDEVGDGYAWIDALSGGWYAVGGWGKSGGWNLGRWPYVIIAHHDSPDRYAVVTYVEGDLSIAVHPDRPGRDADTDKIAAFYWRHHSDGPADLPERDNDIPDGYRGRYRWDADHTQP